MRYLQQTITNGRYTLPLAVLLTLTGWAAVYMFFPVPHVDPVHPLEIMLNDYLPGWGQRLLTLVCTFVAGYFLVQFNNAFLLIRRRASLQTSFYLLFITACPGLHTNYLAGIGSVFVLFSVYSLFKTYQNPRPMAYVLNSFVFLGLATLLFPHLICYIPVFLFGASYVNNLNFRNFMAAILGLALPYFLLWSYAYLAGNMPLFYGLFAELTQFTAITADSLLHQGWVTIIYFLILYIVSASYCITNPNKDKISTRINLRFMITFTFFLFLYLILQPERSAFLLPVIIAGISILAAHYFVLTNTKGSNLFFVCTVIGLMLLFGFNLWTLS